MPRPDSASASIHSKQAPPKCKHDGDDASSRASAHRTQNTMGHRLPKRRLSTPDPSASGEPYLCLRAKAQEALPYLTRLPIPTADPTLEAGHCFFWARILWTTWPYTSVKR